MMLTGGRSLPVLVSIYEIFIVLFSLPSPLKRVVLEQLWWAPVSTNKVIRGIVFQQIPFFFCSIPIVNPNPSMLCRMPRKAWQKRLEDRIIQILWLSHLYCRPERDVLIFHWCGWKLPNLLSQCATVYTHFAGISVVLFLLCSPKCPDLWKAHYLVLKWSLALRKKAL